MNQYELIKKWEAKADDLEERAKAEHDYGVYWSMAAQVDTLRECADDLKGMTY